MSVCAYVARQPHRWSTRNDGLVSPSRPFPAGNVVSFFVSFLAQPKRGRAFSLIWPGCSHGCIHTLVRNLEDGPLHLVLLLAFVTRVLGVFHLVGELEEGVFDVVETVRRRLAVLRCSNGGHVGDCDMLLA